MEVIEHGSMPVAEEWREDIICQKFDEYDTVGCDAELRIEASDLVLRYFKGTHFRHYYTAIQCPECNKFTRVQNIPSTILEVAYTGEKRTAATFDGFEDG